MSDEIKEYKVKITKQAKYYMRDICDYIAIKLEAPETAKNLLATLKKRNKEFKSFSYKNKTY